MALPCWISVFFFPFKIKYASTSPLNNLSEYTMISLNISGIVFCILRRNIHTGRWIFNGTRKWSGARGRRRSNATNFGRCAKKWAFAEQSTGKLIRLKFICSQDWVSNNKQTNFRVVVIVKFFFSWIKCCWAYFFARKSRLFFLTHNLKHYPVLSMAKLHVA